MGRNEAPFVLRTEDASGIGEVTARAVIDASGTYAHPNRLSSNGLDPLGWDEVKDAVSHALPDVLGRDRARFARRRTLVVGAGHSAANTLLALARLASTEPGTSITWAIRNANAVRVSSSDDDQLAARATLGSAVDAPRRLRRDREGGPVRDRFASTRRRRSRRERPSRGRASRAPRRRRRQCHRIPARPGHAPRGATRAR